MQYLAVDVSEGLMQPRGPQIPAYEVEGLQQAHTGVGE